MSTTMRPSSMVTFGFGITGANCRCSPVWCFGGGKFRWGPGTKPGPITGGTLGGGGSLGELGSSSGGGGTESGIGLAGGCGGKGGEVGLVFGALMYDVKRLSSGNGFVGGGSVGGGFIGGSAFGGFDGIGAVGGGILYGMSSLATAAAASGTKPDAF